MRVVIFDIETFGLSVDLGMPLAMVAAEYVWTPDGRSPSNKAIKIFRADEYPEWEAKEEGMRRSQPVSFVKDVHEYLMGFDVLVAHNGKKFDRPYLNTLAMKYGLGTGLKWKKLIDPVWAARLHLRLSWNGLGKIIDYFEVDDKKTPIHWSTWIKATIDGDKKAMDEIVEHCVLDVKALHQVYDIIRELILKVDQRGSIG